MAVGMDNKSLFCVLFIHVIYVCYFLSRQWLMFVFKALRNDSTRVQLDLIKWNENENEINWDQHSRFVVGVFFRPFLQIYKHKQCSVHTFEFPECSTAYSCGCAFHAEPSRLVFVWFDWKIWSVRSPSQRKFKLPADLSELHLVWGCYKLGPLFTVRCQQNGGCQEVEGLGKVSC